MIVDAALAVGTRLPGASRPSIGATATFEISKALLYLQLRGSRLHHWPGEPACADAYRRVAELASVGVLTI